MHHCRRHQSHESAGQNGDQHQGAVRASGLGIMCRGSQVGKWVVGCLLDGGLTVDAFKGIVDQAHVKFPSSSLMARRTWPNWKWSVLVTNPHSKVLSQTALINRGVPFE